MSDNKKMIESEPYSEDEPPHKDEISRYKWRLDPDESFSDWKIEIVTTGGDGENTDPALSTKTYHVHKADLAVGDRKSEYFARLFNNPGHFKESTDLTSRIELDPLAADAFPALLDYMYAPEKPLAITIQTATAMYYLGEYFEMRHLRWDAKTFIQKSLSTDNAETYYEHAKLYHNERVLNMVAVFLGKNIMAVNPESSIVKNVDPQLWVKSSTALDGSPSSALKWSTVVSQLGCHHLEELDQETFHTLTRPEIMRKVDPQVALTLCELEDKIQKMDPKVALTLPELKDKKEKCDSEEPGSLTSLQERCSSALVEDFKKTVQSFKEEETLKNLKNRKSTFLVDLLVKSFQKVETATTSAEAAEEDLAAAETDLAAAEKTCSEQKKILDNLWIADDKHEIFTSSVLMPVPTNITAHLPRMRDMQTLCTNSRLTSGNPDYYADCPLFYYLPDPS